MAFLTTLATIAVVFGLLVTFHEFGHYLLARWMGVQVLSFSIGFGPVVWSVHRGGTEYAVRLLPLGGYVRMLGHDPAGEPDEAIADDPRAYHNKAVWRRTLIIAAGPLFNFLLALLVLFGSALALERQLVSSRIGTAIPGGPAARAGLRSGDVIRTIGGEPVYSFEDVRREVSRRAAQPTRFEVDRDGAKLAVTVTPRAHIHPYAAELGLTERKGQALILADEPLATVAVDPGGPAWQAGLRSGDRVVAVGSQPVKTLRQLESALAAAGSSGVALRWQVANWPAPVERAALRQAVQAAQQSATTRSAAVNVGTDRPSLATLGLRPGFALVGPVVRDSTEDRELGLQPADEVLALDGKAVAGTHELGERMAQPFEAVLLDPAYRDWPVSERLTRLRAAVRPRPLTVRHTVRDQERARLAAIVQETAQPLTVTERWLVQQPAKAEWLARGWFDRNVAWQPKVELNRDERPELAIDLYAAVDYAEAERVANPAPLAYALQVTRERFVHGATLILTVTGELFKGNVSIKEVGGPIRMAQMTSEAADRGLQSVLELLVGLSINLGIVNLLPVPLLDGGHLLFLAIEAVRRQPASLRVRQIAAYAGFALIGLLFLLVMKNDTQRLLASWLNP